MGTENRPAWRVQKEIRFHQTAQVEVFLGIHKCRLFAGGFHRTSPSGWIHMCMCAPIFIDIMIIIIIYYTPGTQMTLALIRKGLLLEGSNPKTKDKQVAGLYYVPSILHPGSLESQATKSHPSKFRNFSTIISIADAEAAVELEIVTKDVSAVALCVHSSSWWSWERLI